MSILSTEIITNENQFYKLIQYYEEHHNLDFNFRIKYDFKKTSNKTITDAK